MTIAVSNNCSRVSDDADLVWLQTGFIGDIVLTTGAMALAKERWPKRRQHLITTKVGAQILRDAPELDSCHVFDKTGANTWSAMRAVKKSLRGVLAGRSAVLLRAHRSTRSMLLARTLGLPEVTFRESSLASLAWCRVPRVAVFHEAHRLAMLLEPLGVPRLDICGAMPRLQPLALDDGIDWQRDLGQHQGPIIAVAPGSVWGTKRWLPEYFADLIRRLTAIPEAKVILLGSAAESSVAHEITRLLGELPQVVNLVGKTSLADMRRILPRAQLLVANDSSPIHYASALGIPTVAIFGATIPQMGFGPLAKGSQTVGVDVSCRPCSDHGPQVCPLGHFACMKDLRVDAVWDACRQVLGM